MGLEISSSYVPLRRGFGNLSSCGFEYAITPKVKLCRELKKEVDEFELGSRVFNIQHFDVAFEMEIRR